MDILNHLISTSSFDELSFTIVKEYSKIRKILEEVFEDVDALLVAILLHTNDCKILDGNVIPNDTLKDEVVNIASSIRLRDKQTLEMHVKIFKHCYESYKLEDGYCVDTPETLLLIR